MCCVRKPRTINIFVRVPGREDRWPGDREIVYVPKVYVPFPAPTLCFLWSFLTKEIPWCFECFQLFFSVFLGVFWGSEGGKIFLVFWAVFRGIYLNTKEKKIRVVIWTSKARPQKIDDWFWASLYSYGVQHWLEDQGALKGTELRWQREPKTQIFAEKTADFRRFTPSPANSSIWRAQETAENRRFSQKTADWASPLARP